jgi:hypothetical protein
MFKGRALSTLTYADVEGFLKEANEEGTRLTSLRTYAA